MKLNFRRFVAILLVAMMTLTALPTAGIAEITGASRGVSLRSVVQPGEGDVYVTYNFVVGGSAYDTQIVKNGGTVTEPATPEVPEGKRFEGWYEGSTPFTFGTVSATENKTVTVEARFTDVYYVYFMTVDGNVFATAEAVAPNYTVALPDNYEPEGKRVTGWKTENGAFTANTKVTADTTVVPEVVDCYWVTFDSQGGEVLPSRYVDKGDTLNLSGIRPTRTGYTFKGWSETANGNVLTSVTPNSDVILYAVWTPAQVNYTVVYWGENANDTNYGTFLGSVTKKDYTGKTVTASKSIPSSITNRNYFKFVESNEQEVKADGSTVVTVLCSRNEYTLTFDLGSNRKHKLTMGGKTYTGGSNVTKYFIKAKYEADIESQWPTVSNFETNSGFAGWRTSNDGWSGGITWVSKRINMTAELCSQGTVYAAYDAEYTHELNYMFESFDQTSGENGKERKRYGGVYYDRSAEYTQTVMANTPSEFGAKEISGMKSEAVTSDWNDDEVCVTFLYYTRNEYTLTLNNYGATTTRKLKYGAPINNPDTPSRPDGFSENAVFKGWYTVDVKNIGESTKPYDFKGKTMPAENMTLFAYWEEAKVNLTVDYGTGYTDEKKIGTKIFEFGSYTDAVTQINQDGKRVLKWVDKETGKTYTVNQPIAKDTTIRPIFAGDTYRVTYVLNGGDNTTVQDERNYGYESKAKVLPGSNAGAPEGKAFAYWQDEAGNVYRPGQYLTMTANVTLTAVYTDIHGKVSLTYHSNFDPDQTYITDEMPDNGEVIVATYSETQLPDRAGYNFLGWNTDSQAKTAEFAPSTAVRLEGDGNDLYAIWEACTDTNHTVEFYHQNTDGTYPTEPNHSVERPGTTGEKVQVELEDKNPRENNKYVWDEEADNIESGIVSAEEPLVLKLYFKLNTARYIIHHYLKDTPIKVAPDQNGEMTIGDELTATAATDLWIEGVNAVKPFGSITINADPTQNIINVYYTKDVTFEGESGTRTYNGNEQTITGIKQPVEGLLEGDTYTGLTHSAKGTDVGEYTGEFTDEFTGAPTFTDARGNKVSYYNVIGKVPGKLTITANTAEVTVTITGNTGTKVYNGSEQSVTGYTTDVVDNTITVALKEGSKAEAKGTNAGKYYMGLTKEDFTVTSANYSNIKVVVKDGYLEITPITTAITITAASGSKTYDGTPLTNAGYTYTPNVLLEGDVLTAVVEGSATNVGDEGKNVVTSYKVMRGNVDVTGNYIFTDSKDGKLTITPREVTLTSETASKEYDGTPLTRPVVTVGGDGFVAGEVTDIMATGNVTYVSDGTVDNTIRYTASASFKEGNYTISETVGKLSITKRPEVIVITTVSRTRAYNGNKLLDNQTTHTGTLAEGDQLIVNFPADAGLTDVGSKANAYESYSVKRDGRDVTDNYTFGEPEIGTLRVTPVEIELTAASGSKTYDGTPLTNGNYTITVGSFVGEEGLAGVTVEGSQTTVGSSANTITGHTLKANTLAKNYHITYQPGMLEVTQNTETISITANSHTWEYDGQPHTDGGYTVSYKGVNYTAAAGESVVLPTGDTLTATVVGTVTNVADSAENNNIVTDVTIVNGNGDSVRDQYATITCIPGGLKITRRGAGDQKVVLTAANNTVVYDGQAHGAKRNDAGAIAVNTSYTITYLAEGHSVQTVAIAGSQTNVGEYPSELVPSDAIIVDGNGKDVTANYLVIYEEGDLKIVSPETVIVEIQGNQKTFTYNANPQGVYGYTVLSISNRAYTAEDFGMVEGASAYAEGTNVGKYDMNLTAESFENLNENFNSVVFKVEDGWLEITPVTEEVTVNITGNHDSKVYNGSEQSVTGYTTDVGDKTITVALKEGKTAEAKGTKAGMYYMGLTKDDFTVTSANYSNIKVVVVDGSLEITPVTDKVTVTIEGHEGTFQYNGMEHTVTGYDVTGISNPLYTKNDFTFSGTAEVKEKNASELPYPMGLNASQFTNVSGNFSNVEFVVTDGQLTINPRNITIRANNVTVEYDGKPHGENGYTLEGDGLAEGETILGLVIDGEQTEADFYPGELKPRGALIGAEGEEIYPKNYEIEYANGNLEITPVAAEVVVTITEHGGKAKYDGTEHVVTGYDVTSISNPLYTEADFVFNGKAEVKGIDAGSYPMLLKSADFVNTSKNFDKVTFVIVDATLEIEKREVTLTSASDEKVYDGKALTNDEVTASGDGFAEDEGAYCGVTGRQLNVGESDNEFTYELLRGTKAGNYKITKEYGTLKVTPVTEEVVVTITGHKGSAKYDGSEKTVTGYEVTGISNALYTENDFTFSGDATASGIHAGKYPMGLKAEDFKNTSENFANVKFVVEDGEMEIQKIALTITSESYEGDYDAQWHQVGYTAEGLAATDAITALEMKNHRILKPGEMVSEFVANTLKITHADGSDATGDYEVTFVPGKLTVNTVIVNYRVFYYYDGVLDESEIEEGTGEVLTQITEYKDKPKDMQFDHVTGFPLTLGLDETKNIIRVYYVHTPLTGNLGAANIGDCIE